MPDDELFLLCPSFAPVIFGSECRLPWPGAAAFSLDNCPEDVYLMNVRRGLFFGFTVAGLLPPPVVTAFPRGAFSCRSVTVVHCEIP